jgi:hypothetical protein
MVPLWTEQVNLAGDYTLYRNVACEFEILFEHPQPDVNTRLELEVMFDVSSIGQNELPLAIFVERKDTVNINFPTEYTLSIPLKEDGKWLGKASNNQVDNSLSYTAIEELVLKSNTPYALKVYANESDAIYGIVKIAARLYENVLPEEGS